jgi:hypothetical protein
VRKLWKNIFDDFSSEGIPLVFAAGNNIEEMRQPNVSGGNQMLRIGTSTEGSRNSTPYKCSRRQRGSSLVSVLSWLGIL